MGARAWSVIVTLLLGLSVVSPVAVAAQSPNMVMGAPDSAKNESSVRLMAGASAVLLGTRASPAINNKSFTEGYLTQPMLMGTATFPRHSVELAATLNLEGITLQRGELNAGMNGEGYVDRRHPHTFIHELVATWKRNAGDDAVVSVAAGKGFVPFGSDDPMSRPLLKYPINHHLAQILERALVIGAASYGPVLLEVARFNGDEPESPSDLPNSRRLFDSWSGRATARIREKAEIQTSFASVVSPEVSAGGGLNQKKWSASGRYESGGLYGFAEYAHTQELEASRDAFAFATMLAEGSVSRHGAMLAARVERTERPEEERLINPFRTPRPASDLSILGRTRWTLLTVNASRSFDVSRSRVAPFVEVGRAKAASIGTLSVFDPKGFYGSDVMWSVSIGLRLGIGMMHHRMGKYGAALPRGAVNMRDMDMNQ